MIVRVCRLAVRTVMSLYAAGRFEQGPISFMGVFGMSNKHVDEFIRKLAQVKQQRESEMNDIRIRLERQQYDADLLQRVRHLVGLEPDPRLNLIHWRDYRNGDKTT